MAVATKPTIPSTPLRTDPSTFSARMESMVDFFSPLLDYIAESNGFTEGEAQTALAAAIAGRLGGADLSSLANRLACRQFRQGRLSKARHPSRIEPLPPARKH